MTAEEAARIAGQIDGWMRDDSLQWLFNAASRIDRQMIVEVGSWLGRSSVAIALGMGERHEMICVDTWKGTKNESEYYFKTEEPAVEIFKNNLLQYVGWLPRMIIGDSVESAALVADESIGLFFLDADHSEEAVTRDLRAWLPKMALGGIMAGHDSWHDPIKRALRNVFAGRVGDASSEIWMVTID